MNKTISLILLLILTIVLTSITYTSENNEHSSYTYEKEINFFINNASGTHDLSYQELIIIASNINAGNLIDYELEITDLVEDVTSNIEITNIYAYSNSVYFSTPIGAIFLESPYHYGENNVGITDESLFGQVKATLYFKVDEASDIDFFQWNYKSHFTYETEELENNIIDFKLKFDLSEIINVTNLETITFHNLYADIYTVYSDNGTKVDAVLEDYNSTYTLLNKSIETVTFNVDHTNTNNHEMILHIKLYNSVDPQDYFDSLFNSDVSFYTNFNKKNIEYKIVIDSEVNYMKYGTILEPVIYMNKKFVGYYFNPDYTLKLINRSVTQNMTLYTRYISENYYIVTKIIGYEHKEIIVLENTKLSTSYPIMSGYVFEGWYLDKDFKNKFHEDTLINEDITLYASFIKEMNSNSNNDELTQNSSYIVAFVSFIKDYYRYIILISTLIVLFIIIRRRF